MVNSSEKSADKSKGILHLNAAKRDGRYDIHEIKKRYRFFSEFRDILLKARRKMSQLSYEGIETCFQKL
jgi:hypothetical protein